MIDPAPPSGLARLRARCFEPVAAHSLALFRIAFGALLAWEAVRFLDSGWIDRYFVEPAFHFKYLGFEWIEPLPQPWLDRLFVVLGAAAALIAVGFATRLAAAFYFAGFGYVFLLEQARYLNHFYLVLLLALLLAWLPTDGVWSVRAWRKGSRTAPCGAIWLLRAQIAVVYGFGALAKLNGDWLRGEPLRQWLRERGEVPWLGPLFEQPWLPWAMSWSGLLLDLLVVPLLLLRRTRPAMFAAITLFHLCNHFLFDIGIFPWLAIGATTLYFEPDWPAQFVARLRTHWHQREQDEGKALFGYDSGVFRRNTMGGGAVPGSTPPPSSFTAPRLAFAAGWFWLALQLLIPLRHLLYPGPVSWTEEGHRFSWHMKLRSKQSNAHFIVTEPATGERRFVDPAAELTDWQVSKMGDRPDMVLQYAHHLAARFAVAGSVAAGSDAASTRRRPQVRAIVDCSLNGRDPQELIDPEVDLAATPRTLWHADWIVPLCEELPPEWRRGKVEFEE